MTLAKRQLLAGFNIDIVRTSSERLFDQEAVELCRFNIDIVRIGNES